MVERKTPRIAAADYFRLLLAGVSSVQRTKRQSKARQSPPTVRRRRTEDGKRRKRGDVDGAAQRRARLDQPRGDSRFDPRLWGNL